MILSLRFIFVIILMTWCQPASTIVGLAAIAAVGGIVSATFAITMSMKNLIAGSARGFGSEPDRQKGRQYYMTAEQNDVIDQFIDMRRESRVNFEAIDSMLPEAIEAPELVNFRQVLGSFFSKTELIDLYYNDVARYADEFLEHSPEHLKNTTVHLISTAGIEELIREVRILLIENPYESILQLFLHHGNEFLQQTGTLQSPQQYLSHILNHYVSTEQKAFLTISFCHHVLEVFDGNEDLGFSVTPMKYLQYEFAHNLNKTVATFQKYMLKHSSTISTEFHRLNPPEHIKDVTYTELERVFQKFATRQGNLVLSNSLLDKIDPCHGKCEDHTKVTKVHCSTEECRYTTCKGTLYDCQYVIDTDAKICVATNDSIRKYDYIIYGDQRRYGQNVECPDDRLVNAFNNMICNQCLCTCADESTHSDRFICTKEQSSNIAANYVITGVRMRKLNHIIYLQIQEGILLPNSQIQENSTRWIPIQSCRANDILELNWYERRQLTLGQVKFPNENQILTGVSFSPSDNGRIIVKATSTVFNISTGELVRGTESTTEPSPPAEHNNAELHLNERSLPTRFQSTYGYVKTDHDKFIKFQTSGMDDDVGQSTIPFLDIQEVAPYPPVPLSGIGVYHKAATPSDAGYVGLSVFTYDIANLLRPDLPSDFHMADIENFEEILQTDD